MGRIVVFGGNGYVGSQVCRAALALGLEVTSVNRSGCPSGKEEWIRKVQWVQGDILNSTNEKREVVRAALVGADGAVSCVGGFGNNKNMMHINGAANVNAVRMAQQAGVHRFTFISTGRSTMPKFILRGYFEGKIVAEDAVAETFGKRATILRPGFIFGVRKSRFGPLPLQCIGGPLKFILELTGLHKLRHWRGLSMALTLPVRVDAVAYTAAAAAAGTLADIELVNMVTRQDACKYKGGPAIVLESEDVDFIGNIVQRNSNAKCTTT